MDPLTIAAIVSGVGSLFGAISGKKRANAQQSLEEQQYNDQVKTYYDEANKAEDQRLQKVNLITAFARANGVDGALSPAILDMLTKRREAAAPPPYRKGGTPGFGWDLAGTIASAAGGIYGAHSASKAASAFKGSNLKGVNPLAGRFGSSAGSSFTRPSFTMPVQF